MPRTRPRPVGPPYGPDIVAALDAATGAVHRMAGMVQLLPIAHRLGMAGIRSTAVACCSLEGHRVEVLDLLRLEAGDLDRLDEGRRRAARQAADRAAALETAMARATAAGRIDLDLLAGWGDRTAGAVCTRGAAGTARLARALRALDDPSEPPLVRLAMAQWWLGTQSARGAPDRRIGPALTALALAATGVLAQPVLRLPGRFAAQPDRYRSLLEGSDPAPWVRWFLEAVRVQAEDDARRAIRLRQVELATAHRLRQLRASGTAVAAAGTLLARPYLSACTLAADLGVTPPTARSAIDQLVASGEVVETTMRRRSRFYVATGMLAEVYGEQADADAVEWTAR